VFRKSLNAVGAWGLSQVGSNDQWQVSSNAASEPNPLSIAFIYIKRLYKQVLCMPYLQDKGAREAKTYINFSMLYRMVHNKACVVSLFIPIILLLLLFSSEVAFASSRASSFSKTST
jgi:hypothetical protein